MSEKLWQGCACGQREGDRVWHMSPPVTRVPCGPRYLSSPIPSPKAAGLGAECVTGHGDRPHQHCQSAHTVSPPRGCGHSTGQGSGFSSRHSTGHSSGHSSERGSHNAQVKEVLLAPDSAVPLVPSPHVLRESCSQAPNCHAAFVREISWECPEMH